jgi:hypothetical protein
MSSSAKAEADICCANCGAAQVDEVKMEDCNHCNHVLCGSEWCRVVHGEKHKEEYEKRKLESHDDDLFKQPERSHRGECPLCFLPMSLDPRRSTFYECCSKVACNGCSYANYMSNGNQNCPFCREPPAEDGEEYEKRMMKRVKANDPATLRHLGKRRYHEGDYDVAFEYWTEAAELGDIDAHYQLGNMYGRGDGVAKDYEKEVYHLEKAAIGGHPQARNNLGCYEHENGNNETAVKHFIIAANLGYENSMKNIWEDYKDGDITKEDLEATLYTHQAALDEMKSTQRKAAENKSCVEG